MATREQPSRPLRDLTAALARAEAEVEQLRAENEYLLESQRDLEEQRDFLSGAYQATPAPVVVLDGEGVVKAANDAAAALLGRPRARVVGLPLRSLVADQDRPVLTRHLQRCQGQSVVVVSELRLGCGQRPLPVELWSRGVARPRPFYPTVVLDMTDRLAERLERGVLRESERTARAESDAKDQFITTLSHELRTPLTPVLAAVSALTAHGSGRPSRHVLQMIQRNVVAEARLIDDLLDAARIRTGKLSLRVEAVDLHEVVEQAVEVLGGQHHLPVDVSLEAPLHHVSGDPGRLRQVFWNLLGNAVKFTPAGGRITVRSWNREGAIRVEVSDTGMGIPAELMRRLFRPFEQGPRRATGGLGLGLAIARGLAELHEGSIVAASAGTGTGARFVVELPTAPAPAAHRETTGPPAAAAVHRRILLVEDHADTSASLSELLAAEGYEVQTADTAASALAVDLDKIDLIVSDLGLPDRTGHELMRELRARRRVPAIALSGFGTEADAQASAEAGFSLHLTKPIDWPSLLAAIERVGTAEPASAAAPAPGR